MSFGDIYQVQPGQDVAPGLPPVDLPKVQGTPARPHIIITPSQQTKSDPWSDLTGDAPIETKTSSSYLPKQEGDPWANLTDKEPSEGARPVSKMEAGIYGASSMATMGAAPWVAGLTEASKTPELPPEQDLAQMDPMTGMTPNSGRFLGGAFNMIQNWVSQHPDPEVQKSYEKGRDDYRDAQDEAFKQQPLPYVLGMISVAPFGPKFGGLKPGATFVERGVNAAKPAAAGGAIFGANTAISEGKDAVEVAKETAKGAGLGIALGAPFGAAVGPRVADTGSTGYRAARTAENLGAPLPRGVTSNNPVVQNAGAATLSVPYFGARMGSSLAKTEEAAGGRLGDIADEAGNFEPTLSGQIEQNKAIQSGLYNNVWSQIDRNAEYPMPRTRAAVDEVKRRRTAAKWSNPEQGLEQFDAAANGATVEGAHRARADARNAGNTASPNPGYDKGDYQYITSEISKDLRVNVARAAADKTAGTIPQKARAAAQAVRDFDQAEKEFGRYADRNDYLSKLVNKTGEPENVLTNLGWNGQTNRFSLSKFVTSWENMPDKTKNALFDPQHIKEIDDIFDMGKHIKWALKDKNTSHTAGVLITFDLARDAVLLSASTGTTLAAGGSLLTAGGVAAGGAGVPIAVMMHWLSSPDTVRALGAWTRAYRGATNSPTPLRIAAFNAATRNLSHNIGVPVENILSRAHAWATGQNEKPAELDQ